MNIWTNYWGNDESSYDNISKNSMYVLTTADNLTSWCNVWDIKKVYNIQL